jgi:hypothetical protein
VGDRRWLGHGLAAQGCSVAACDLNADTFAGTAATARGCPGDSAGGSRLSCQGLPQPGKGEQSTRRHTCLRRHGQCSRTSTNARRITKCSTVATSLGDHASCASADRCTVLLMSQGEGLSQRGSRYGA